jgi:hypothetical protein
MNQCTPDRFLYSRTHHTKGPAYAGETGMVRARLGVPEFPDPPYSGPTCPIYILLSYKLIHTHTQMPHDESFEIEQVSYF